MQKDTAEAEELKKKVDKLTEPEKRLVLAFIKGIESGAERKNGSRGRAGGGTRDCVREYSSKK